MTGPSRIDSVRHWLGNAIDRTRLLGRRLSLKALTFAMIGVVNTLVDYGVFLLARAVLTGSQSGIAAAASLSDFCQCGSATTATLVIANVISWSVAVTGSYILNSSITFAAESGRKLRWRSYLKFVLSGVAGLLTN